MRKRVQTVRGFMLLAAAGAVTTGILAGPPARAVTGQQIHNVGSGECLALNPIIGNEAVQELCSSTNLYEFWQFVQVGTGLYDIKNGATSRCLVPSSSSVPTTVVQATCSTNLNFAWRVLPGSPTFEITNYVDGASMHPNSNSNNSGATIYVHPATSDSHYEWTLLGLSI